MPPSFLHVPTQNTATVSELLFLITQINWEFLSGFPDSQGRPDDLQWPVLSLNWSLKLSFNRLYRLSFHWTGQAVQIELLRSHPVIIKCLHYVLSVYFTCVWYFSLTSIRLHKPTLCLISISSPSGAPAGCCCFLRHLCWHRESRLHGPSALLSLQNRKNTLLPDGHRRQNTSQLESTDTRQQTEGNDKTRFQPLHKIF